MSSTNPIPTVAHPTAERQPGPVHRLDCDANPYRVSAVALLVEHLTTSRRTTRRTTASWSAATLVNTRRPA